MRLALAIAAASRAAAATPSDVSVCDAAKPHAPFTSARMPMPIESVSFTCVICFSRVPTKFCRYRPMRASAHVAPAAFAAFSASISSSLIGSSSNSCTPRG